jgi:hypothetical protein
MTPKEKAKELVERFDLETIGVSLLIDERKQCALICVDEILETYLSILARKYWQKVKKEIGKV